MLADGGSACTNVRWYCLDTAGCTERWTTRRIKAAEILPVTTDPPQDADTEAGEQDAEPASAWRPPAARAG